MSDEADKIAIGVTFEGRVKLRLNNPAMLYNVVIELDPDLAEQTGKRLIESAREAQISHWPQGRDD